MTNFAAEELVWDVREYLRSSGGNQAAEEDAPCPEFAGLLLYDQAYFGFGRANDPLFPEVSRPQAVHPEFMLPREWLAQGEAVISFSSSCVRFGKPTPAP